MLTNPPTPHWLMTQARPLLDKWKNKQEKVERLSWDDYFFLQAYLVSNRSLDAQTKCGAILISPEKDIISTGYNSFVRNIDDTVLPNLRDEKYPFFLHAEHNAILACARHGKKCKGSILYVTGPPCINCLQLISQAGISEIYYLNHNIHNGHEKEKGVWNILVSLLSDNLRLIKIEPSKKLLKNIASIQNLSV